MKRAAAVFVVSALAIAVLSAQQTARPARDVPAPTPVGTASMWGTVMIEGPDNRPARGAVVTINHTDRTYGDTAVTDEQGRFEFKNIPAGRYLLGAEKEGYIPMRFGATRPGREGTPIAITDGLHVDGMVLKIVRGAVLTGTVRDPNGEPAQGVTVVAKRSIASAGGRRWVDSYNVSDPTTDDRGVYRIYSLFAGDYAVQAIPIHGDHDGRSASARPTTATDVAWARAMLQSPAEIAARGTPSAPPAATSMGFAPIYYPNTLQQSAAAIITVGAGEERAGLDFTLSLLPTFRVSGVVTTSAGALPKNPALFLAELSGTGGDGYSIRQTYGATFSFAGVSPGRYSVVAIMEDSRMWAIENITVTGQDQAVALTLQDGLTATGQLVFQGTRPVPPDLTQVGLFWNVVAIAGGVVIAPPTGRPNADGTFALKGLVPGSYRLMASVRDGDPRSGNGWVLRSAMAGDRDIADIPLEIRPGAAVGQIVVTFTDKPTELSGRLHDASGRSASDYFIIVFSADERTWSAQSRRIVQTRPASDGQFSVRGLPPGDYFLAALTDVEGDEWYDAGFLQGLIPSAAKIMLGEGEKKVQDIRIAGVK